MNIQYNGICIRNAEKADCAQLAVWWNDGSVMAHAGFPNGLNTSAEKIAEQIADDSDDTIRRLIIEYEGRPIGETSFTVTEDNSAEIGIKICEPEYQEKGLGRVILSLLIRALFDAGREKILLDTNLKNTRARHVYEMLGFRKLRINVDSWTDQVGIPQSFIDYELTPEHFHSFLAEDKGGQETMSKVLVAYFSASGVTARVAERLAKAAGADLFEIVPAVPYTKADLNWMNRNSRSSVEMKDRSSRPAIASRIDDPEQYGTVFVGFPIWWYREPSIIDTFMESYDFTGKTVVPFATSGSSGLGDSARNLQALAKGAKVEEGKRFPARVSEEDLAAWAAKWL